MAAATADTAVGALTMRICIWFTVCTLLALLAFAGCNEAADTGSTTEQGANNAVGVADKMSEGTLGDADMDSGESAEEGGE
jgi:hypothetical protein